MDLVIWILWISEPRQKYFNDQFSLVLTMQMINKCLD